MSVLPLWARMPSLRRLGEWWLREFLRLLPERVAQWLVGRGPIYLSLLVDQDIVTLTLQDSNQRILASERAGLADYSHEKIDMLLKSKGLQRRDVELGVRLPAEMFFHRELILPSETASSLREIVTQDLVRRTPFKSEDIYSDHAAVSSPKDGKIVVSQWIARRDFVHDALLPLKFDPEDLAFIAGHGIANGVPWAVIRLRSGESSGRSWTQRAILALGCSAVCLALVACGLQYWRQQEAIDDLEARIATARVKAQQVRVLVDNLQEKQKLLVRLRTQRNHETGLMDLLEDATRVLPAHSWLAEFRLTEAPERGERVAAMTGFSAAAPSLVGIISRSSLLYDAALTAPVTVDTSEGRDRFALQAKVRRVAQPKETVR